MIRRLLTNRLVISFILPALLLGIWFVLTLVFNSEESVSVLTYRMNHNTDKIELRTNEVHKGQKVNGEFLARDNNLGVVSVRFNTFKRINDDILIFRIKEKGQEKWFYENKHRVDQFQPDEFFTFGLPIIPDSKGNTYQFQLESTMGKSKNAVAISTIDPVVLTKYQFTRSVLLTDKSLLMQHIYKKFLNTIFNFDYFLSSVVYLLPFFLYLLWVNPFRLKVGVKKWKSNKKVPDHHFRTSFLLIWGCVFVNIFFVRDLSSVIAYMILFISWILFSKKYYLDSSITFFVASTCLLLIPLLFIFNKDVSERSAVWMYYFLAIGIGLSLTESDESKNILRDYRFVLNKLFS